ncbi:MAG TPA: Holliday junction branch migration protein RuvA [Cytophagales bacterium]|jgi:Holliday junction DNA helicase RuvA|nr:Holliday junction branch migration protein RuvA [Cytophagales bacterium]
MISFIKGKKLEIDPTKIIIDVNDIGYELKISLRTYSEIKEHSVVNLFTHLQVKEDSHTLFGFYDKSERKTFLSLLSISGVGPSTAIMILSSLSSSELNSAIISSDVLKIKSVKGIGLKTAERIILELKDKISKNLNQKNSNNFLVERDNTIKNEALSALSSLGISKNVVNNHIDRVLDNNNNNISLEDLIREVLKRS